MTESASPATPLDPWASGPVTTRATCVLATNPGPMTLDGTNTWVLLEPGSTEAVVVDPGQLRSDTDERHLLAVLAQVEQLGAHVALTIVTHHHFDHAEAGDRFAELTGAPTKALADLVSDSAESAGEPVLTVGGLDLTVVPTPGHTADSLCLVVPADNALLTGDTILGRGTTVVAWPDGQLGAYLHSLERIERLTGSGEVLRILPGHGPQLRDAAAVVRAYREHRASRLEEVRAAVEAGATTPQAVVERVYAAVPREVWPAAELSVRAQLDYLSQHPGGPTYRR